MPGLVRGERDASAEYGVRQDAGLDGGGPAGHQPAGQRPHHVGESRHTCHRTAEQDQLGVDQPGQLAEKLSRRRRTLCCAGPRQAGAEAGPASRLVMRAAVDPAG